MPSSLWSAEAGASNRVSHLLIALFFVVFCAFPAWGASCPPPANKDEELLARYVFELRNNRQTTCPPGGDFFIDPDEINYAVSSFCRTEEQSGTLLYSITYDFIDCDDNKPTKDIIDVRIKECSDNTAALVQQPIQLLEVKAATMPANYECPNGFDSYKKSEDQDIDFTPVWEWAHMAEAAWKYDLTVNDPSTGPECNAYVSTTIDQACINKETQEYEGYATIKSQCVSDYKKKSDHSIYVRGKLLGTSPEDARSKCPWPEILEGSSGYDEKFTFLQGSSDTEAAPVNASDSVSSAPTTSLTITPTPTATVVASPETTAPPNLMGAIQCLEGAGVEVIDSTDQNELRAECQVFNKMNDTDVALAIASPNSIEQVKKTVQCLQENGIRAVPRSGGHSYEAYSVLEDAVTIDLKYLNQVSVSSDKSTAVVGAGTRLGPLYYEVWNAAPGKVAIGGTCPGVGVGGLILGGGIGTWSRSYGLSCDQIVSLQMVDYKGDVHVASATENEDLLWASCGGGGGNFGIVTEFTLKLATVPESYPRFKFSVPASQSVPFLQFWQENLVKNAPPQLGMQVYPGEGRDYGVTVDGNFNGNQADLETTLNTLGISATNNSFQITDYAVKNVEWLQDVVDGAYYQGVEAPEDLNDVETLKKERTYTKIKSFFILPDMALSAKDFEAMAEWKKSIASASGGGYGYVQIDMWGPQSTVATTSSAANSAFPYRNALYSVQYSIEWESAEDTETNLALINQLASKLEPTLGRSPPMYVNYLDNSVPVSSYYGASMQRLMDIKEKYDPGNYFRNPMTIPDPENSSDNTDTEVVDGNSFSPNPDANDSGNDIENVPENAENDKDRTTEEADGKPTSSNTDTKDDTAGAATSDGNASGGTAGGATSDGNASGGTAGGATSDGNASGGTAGGATSDTINSDAIVDLVESSSTLAATVHGMRMYVWCISIAVLAIGTNML